MGLFLGKHANNNSSNGVAGLYEALTPKNNIDNIQGYKDALDWALEEPTVLNIAITGPYGSGKSSVIESCLRDYEKEKIAHISLAAFNQKGQDISENEKGELHGELKTGGEQNNEEKNHKSSGEKLEEELEIGILKQLFYSVSVDRIPLSRYRKLQSENNRTTNIKTVGLMTIVCALLLFVWPEKTVSFIKIINSREWFFSALLYAGFGALGFIAFRKFIVWSEKNGSILEVKLNSRATVKSQGLGDESVFNKNIDEIVYFFECTGKTIVIIEDLDRFQNTEILVALRDLNILLNNTYLKNRIKFIYAIKDDMFMSDTERTKFFDFVVPIVPYISSLNSGDILRRKIDQSYEKGSDIFSGISDTFVKMISPFLRDMRVLISTCNEFCIWKKTVKDSRSLQLKDENMFAMVAFKNLYPRDFAELQEECSHSIVKKAFLNLHSYIESRDRLIHEECDKLQNTIQKLDNEKLRNTKEIKAALICALPELYQVSGVVTEINNHPVKDILSDSLGIDELFEENDIIVITLGGNYRGVNPIQKKSSDVKSKLEEYGKYFSRIESQKGDTEKEKTTAQKRAEVMKHEIYQMDTYTMQQCIDKFGIEFLDEDVRKNEFLVFLLRKGYIDESYEECINYFHPQSISTDEMNFILNLKTRTKNFSYDYPLVHIENVFDRLAESEFGQKEIFNYSLIDYLLEKYPQSDYSHYFFNQLANHSEESIEFCVSYIENGSSVSCFIRYLCKKNKAFWKDISTLQELSYERKIKLLECLLNYADIEDVIALDDEDDEKGGELKEFMLSNPNILRGLAKVPVKKQLELISGLNVSFLDVDIASIDEEIRRDIYENMRYVLNEKMIKRIFEWKMPKVVKMLERKNYTTIKNSSLNRLIDYVHGCVLGYVKEVFLAIETNTEEDEDAVETLLKRIISFDEDEETSIKILEKESGFVLQSIDTITGKMLEEDKLTAKKVLDYLLVRDRIRPNWENASEYIRLYGVTETWIGFVERQMKFLVKSKGTDTLDNAMKESIMFGVDSLESFRIFVSKVEVPLSNGLVAKLEKEKTGIMVENGKLPFTPDYWREMGIIAPEYRVTYALKNHIDFFATIDKNTVSDDEVNKMLLSKQLSDNEEKTLLQLIQPDKMSMESAKTIKELSISIGRAYFLSAWQILDEKDKCMLLYNQLDSFDDRELSKLFSELGSEYQRLCLKSRKHVFKIRWSEYNEKLLGKLQKRGYVSDVSQITEPKRNLLGEKEYRFLVGDVRAAKRTSGGIACN